MSGKTILWKKKTPFFLQFPAQINRIECPYWVLPKDDIQTASNAALVRVFFARPALHWLKDMQDAVLDQQGSFPGHLHLLLVNGQSITVFVNFRALVGAPIDLLVKQYHAGIGIINQMAVRWIGFGFDSFRSSARKNQYRIKGLISESAGEPIKVILEISKSTEGYRRK